LIGGLGSPPTVNAVVTRDSAGNVYNNSKVSMKIDWVKSIIWSKLNVLGYQLLVDDGLGNDDQYSVKFDSGNNPQALSTNITNLT
jgi:hypothetical protein